MIFPMFKKALQRDHSGDHQRDNSGHRRPLGVTVLPGKDVLLVRDRPDPSAHLGHHEENNLWNNEREVHKDK